MDEELFKKNPRAYAINMVDDGMVDARSMVHLLLVYMSSDDVRDALDCNELSPRFHETEE